MRYRALDENGDYTFGQGAANFLVDSPACVGQAVLTRLRLWEGEWFLDITDGTPWAQSILGENKMALYDIAIRDRILGTPNVTRIAAYESNLDRATRALSVTATIDTAFGQATVTVAQPVPAG